MGLYDGAGCREACRRRSEDVGRDLVVSTDREGSLDGLHVELQGEMVTVLGANNNVID